MANNRSSLIKKKTNAHRHDVYPIRAGKKLGRCLIINNTYFYHLKDRIGSSNDALRLNRIFKELGFTVIPENENTGQEMKKSIKREATHKENEDCSAFVLIVLTHGDEGILCGTDFHPGRREPVTYVTYREIVNILSNINCKVLKRKPKMCFFQACNGYELSSLVKDAAVTVQIVNGDRVPEASDILMSFAAQEGYCTVRSALSGGIYAYNLAQVLMDYAWTCDISEILDIVEAKTRSDVVKYWDKKHPVPIELCLSTSSLKIGWSKKFYFNPSLIVNGTVGTFPAHHQRRLVTGAAGVDAATLSAAILSACYMGPVPALLLSAGFTGVIAEPSKTIFGKTARFFANALK